LTGFFVGKNQAYLRLVWIVLKLVDSLMPTAVTPLMMATAIRAAIRPYSMAVAPAWLRTNFLDKLCMTIASKWDSRDVARRARSRPRLLANALNRHR
jgi:hypothetical protein